MNCRIGQVQWQRDLTAAATAAGCVACAPSLGSQQAGGSRSRPLLFPPHTLSLLQQRHPPCFSRCCSAGDLVLSLRPAPRRLPADDYSPRKMPPNSKRAALASTPAGKCTWSAEHGSDDIRHAPLALTARLTHGDMAGVKKKDGAFTRTGQACDRCKVCSKPIPPPHTRLRRLTIITTLTASKDPMRCSSRRLLTLPGE